MRLACCQSVDDYPKALPVELVSHSTVVLKSFHGAAVIARPDGTVGLHDDKDKPSWFTRFSLESNSDGTVSLRSKLGGYLVVELTGAVKANGWSAVDKWGKFTLKYNEDGTVSFRSFLGSYVTAQDWGVLTATGHSSGDWEKFTVIYRHEADQRIPNDESFDKLWGMDHFANRDIDAPEAWEHFTGTKNSRGIVLAVIDTGIDYKHKELKDQMWVNPGEIAGNGIDDDGNGYVDDVHGYDFANDDGDPMDDNVHGTHCSGTIAAAGNNSFGVAGVAWQGVRLMALKFLTAEGSGRTSDAVKAVDYAVAMGARIASNSWGGAGSSSAMRVAIERAEVAGMLFVAAAGNDGTDNDDLPHFPSNYQSSNIIAVASTTKAGPLSDFSCYGRQTVHVAAPGSGIYSTVPGGKYKTLSGTSMACPHVSGLAALVWLYRPNLSMMQVKDIILKSTVSDVALEKASISGGRINALRALKLAATYEAPQPPVHLPQALDFKDVDPRVGIVSGLATITAAADESDVDYYAVYFISTAGFLLESVGRVPADGGKTLALHTNGSLVIPQFAAGFVAVAGNASGETAPSGGARVAVEDYGVPDFGPQSVAWTGDLALFRLSDADGRPGFVEGAINEKTVSSYHAYWRNSSGGRGPFLGSAPAIGFSEPTCDGSSCGLLNQSKLGNGLFLYNRDAYDNDEEAVIAFSGPARVTITRFATEKHYDALVVGGQSISGANFKLPLTVEIPDGPATIEWTSDSSETDAGWTLELQQSATDVVIPVQSTKLLEHEVEVVTAYRKEERLEGVSIEISDYIHSEMPPSAAYAPQSVHFRDDNESPGVIEGVASIEPSEATMSHKWRHVGFYRLYFADSEDIEVGPNWTVAAPKNHSEAALVSIPKMPLPADALWLVARAGNKRGLGSGEARVALVDVVRSQPTAANFSGDEDPVEGQITGSLTIAPAEFPAGILGYGVYVANGTVKDNFVAMVAAASDGGEVVHLVQFAVLPGQSLLVVSMYANGEETTEGVSVEVEDIFEDKATNDFRRMQQEEQQQQQQQQQQPAEPWLRRPRQPAYNEVQLLWTAMPMLHAATSGTAHSATTAGTAHSATTAGSRVLGSLTIPGLVGKQLGGEMAPPSAEQRAAIAASLAEALLLPSVGAKQVRLLRGLALSGAAARLRADGHSMYRRDRRVSSAGAAQNAQEPDSQQDTPALLVEFEVLPGDDADKSQVILDGVESRLILLSRGGAATARFDASLEARLLQAGAAVSKGLRTLLSEPQQLAPRRQAGEEPVFEATVGGAPGRTLAELDVLIQAVVVVVVVVVVMQTCSFCYQYCCSCRCCCRCCRCGRCCCRCGHCCCCCCCCCDCLCCCCCCCCLFGCRLCLFVKIVFLSCYFVCFFVVFVIVVVVVVVVHSISS
ncbi:unnamed protein product [Polarella glacialis]|uniref:subtilisin n=1 Tax=Polarella glacialis TaxID=89957 RepID=A0A813HBZ9_POLGL|nr:unnamed protein product [Polarella glacialis]